MNTKDTATHHHLLDGARSTVAEEREAAARGMKACLESESIRSTLLDLLGDPDWRVRRAAVESFLERRLPEAVPELLQALYEEANAGRRNASLDILTQYGSAVLPYLKPHLGSPSSDVRMFLLNILGDLRDGTYLDFIISSLNDEEPNLVSAAILALGNIADPDSIAHIRRFLHSEDLWLRFQAIEAAGQTHDPGLVSDLIPLLKSLYCRKPVIKALGKLPHSDAIEALLSALITNKGIDRDALAALHSQYHFSVPRAIQKRRQSEIRSLCSRLPAQTRQALVQELQSADVQFRSSLMEILGWAKAHEAIPFIIDFLRDPEMIESTVRTLFDFGKDAAPFLIDQLKNTADEDEQLVLLHVLNETQAVTVDLPPNFFGHSSEEIRYQAFKILIRSNFRAEPKFLLEGLLDRYPSVSEICREPLLTTCSEDPSLAKKVVDKLTGELRVDEAWRRAHALEFLVQLDEEESPALLIQAIKDEDGLVRQAAIQGMARVVRPEFREALMAALADEEPRVREMAALALRGYQSQEVTDALLSSLADEVLWVRLAIYSSAPVGDDRVRNTLLQQLPRENPVAIATILRALSNHESMETVLLPYLNHDDPEVRRSACESISRFPSSESFFRLFALLKNDPDWSVRVAALRALGKAKPFRFQEVLVEGLHTDPDPFVRKEILAILQEQGVDDFPDIILDFLIDPVLSDDAYQFLSSLKPAMASRLVEKAAKRSPLVRGIIQSLNS